MFKRLTIIGVGLIGGSLARAIRQVNGCEEIVGCGRDQAHLQQALELGVVDRIETDIAQAVSGADMIVVCVPLAAMPAVFQAMAGHLADNVVITDVGSAKLEVIKIAQQALADQFPVFVPGHPIAGTEKSGVTASFPALFEDRTVILTPTAQTDARAIEHVRQLWTYTGARLTTMDAQHHDHVLAATSHMPHILAYALVDTLARLDDSEEIFTYAAGGFRDFTRIASSDPVMWRDVCIANRDEILTVLAEFQTTLNQLMTAIEQADGQVMMEIFSRAKQVRDRAVVK